MAEGQEALFEIEGPDEDGCIWICSTEGRKVWFHNLSQARGHRLPRGPIVARLALGVRDFIRVEDRAA